MSSKFLGADAAKNAMDADDGSDVIYKIDIPANRYDLLCMEAGGLSGNGGERGRGGEQRGKQGSSSNTTSNTLSTALFFSLKQQRGGLYYFHLTPTPSLAVSLIQFMFGAATVYVPCVQGISKALNVFKGSAPSPVFRLVEPKDGVRQKMIQKPETMLVRPFVVGRCTLTPPDPQLKGARYPGGFNPCTYQVKKRFQNLLSMRNLHRYVVVCAVLRGVKFDQARYNSFIDLQVGLALSTT
jgi:hypothetical protein